MLDWAATKDTSITVHALEDAFGPAPHHATADAIVATPETVAFDKTNCKVALSIREKLHVPLG